MRPGLNEDRYCGWIDENQINSEQEEIEEEEQYQNKTKEDFALLYEAMKNEANYYRLKSVYCYDIMEHPTYQKLKKTIKKIREYTGEKFSVD